MKPNLKCLVIVACLLTTALQVHPQGYLVPNGVSLYPGSSTGPGSITTVIQNPTNGDFTGFFLDPQGANRFLFNPFLDEQVRTFLVSPNDAISLQPILANSYGELTYPNTYFFANRISFYLGFYTGYNPWIITNGTSVYTGIYTDPVFAWGEFMNDNGVIRMLDSALEYGGGGIYAGTQNIIQTPEPGIFGLSALGALLLGWRVLGRRR